MSATTHGSRGFDSTCLRVRGAAQGGLSYAREEVAGGPLENGSRNWGATSDGEEYSYAELTLDEAGTTSATAAAVSPTGVLPAVQSPRQLHCFGW